VPGACQVKYFVAEPVSRFDDDVLCEVEPGEDGIIWDVLGSGTSGIETVYLRIRAATDEVVGEGRAS
jgi:hypothetical protein